MLYRHFVTTFRLVTMPQTSYSVIVVKLSCSSSFTNQELCLTQSDGCSVMTLCTYHVVPSFIFSYPFTMKRLPIAVVALACAFTSCKKDSEDVKPVSKADLLTAKNWRASASIYTFTSGTSTQTIDFYNGIDPTFGPYTPACTKDDFLKFNTDKSAVFDEGPTRCSASDPQSSKSAWDFNSNESKLLLLETSSSTSSELYDIVELSATALIIKQTKVDNNTTRTNTYTFTAF